MNRALQSRSQLRSVHLHWYWFPFVRWYDCKRLHSLNEFSNKMPKSIVENENLNNIARRHRKFNSRGIFRTLWAERPSQYINHMAQRYTATYRASLQLNLLILHTVFLVAANGSAIQTRHPIY